MLIFNSCKKDLDLGEIPLNEKSLSGQYEGLRVVNGRLVFLNEDAINSFAKLWENKTDEDLYIFESDMGYTSYKSFLGESFYNDDNPLQSSLLATIINQNGIHQVGDTAIKVHFTDGGYQLYILSGVTEERINELNELKVSEYIYMIDNEDVFKDKEKSGCGNCLMPLIQQAKIEFEYDGLSTNPNTPGQMTKYIFKGRAHFDNIGSLKHVYHLTKHKRKNAVQLTPPQGMRTQPNVAQFEYKKGSSCIAFAGDLVQVESFSSAPVLRKNFYVNTRCARKAKVNGWFRGKYLDYHTNLYIESQPLNYSFDL